MQYFIPSRSRPPAALRHRARLRRHVAFERRRGTTTIKDRAPGGAENALAYPPCSTRARPDARLFASRSHRAIPLFRPTLRARPRPSRLHGRRPKASGFAASCASSSRFPFSRRPTPPRVAFPGSTPLAARDLTIHRQRLRVVRNVNRMLAYSSIAQRLLARRVRGSGPCHGRDAAIRRIAAVAFYLLAYALMNLARSLLRLSPRAPPHRDRNLHGIGFTAPAPLASALFVTCSHPLTAGSWANQVFRAALDRIRGLVVIEAHTAISVFSIWAHRRDVFPRTLDSVEAPAVPGSVALAIHHHALGFYLEFSGQC